MARKTIRPARAVAGIEEQGQDTIAAVAELLVKAPGNHVDHGHGDAALGKGPDNAEAEPAGTARHQRVANFRKVQSHSPDPLCGHPTRPEALDNRRAMR